MFAQKDSNGGMLMLTLVSVALTVPVIYYMKRIDDSLQEMNRNTVLSEDADL